MIILLYKYTTLPLDGTMESKLELDPCFVDI